MLPVSSFVPNHKVLDPSWQAEGRNMTFTCTHIQYKAAIAIR